MTAEPAVPDPAGLANQLKEILEPMLSEGNAYAAMSYFRLVAAEDPDAVAQEILDEARRAFEKLVEIFAVFASALDAEPPPSSSC